MKDRIPAEPLRGEAAYRARKAEIAKRSESACADAAVRRAAKEARASGQRARTTGRSGGACRASRSPEV